MATVLTKFEVFLPLDSGSGTVSDAAIQSFLSNLALLTSYDFINIYEVDNLGSVKQGNLTFGLLTAAQSVTALALLTTLNTALGFNVLCYVYNVTKEP